MDISRGLCQEDSELMGGGACHQLHLLRTNRRGATRALVANHPLPSASYPTCHCPLLNYTVWPRLCVSVWL